ncbi:MAG TPA: trehalase family glycosidase [Opitutaceae bacterium]|nr:trehalase family glycosidase [Opitutaceae bacterium]
MERADPAAGYFFDWNRTRGERSRADTLAGVLPLFVRLATPEEAAATARTIRRRFLRPGGVVTTLTVTGQQWDAPNGWAPLEWMTIRGLENYGHHALAAEIARRWLALNQAVYARTGRMMEKYDVENLHRAAGGGEYPSQDGFGWTNGVWLALSREDRKQTR